MNQARRSRFTLGVGLVLVLALAVAGCSGGRIIAPQPAASPAPFLPPPPAAPTPVDVILEGTTPEPPRPTPTPPCTANLTFLRDLTIDDGTLVDPGEKLDKRWQVINSGTCNWDEHYRVRLIAGPSLGAATEQALIPARSGAQAVIRILFTAPYEPGTYRSAWQAYNPRGEPIGDLFFIEFVVRGG
jgi:hypothetical protein